MHVLGQCYPTAQTEGEGVVPGVAVVVAFVLVIISIMVLVWYVHQIGRLLRVAALIELVGTDTRKVLDEVYADMAYGLRMLVDIAERSLSELLAGRPQWNRLVPT